MLSPIWIISKSSISRSSARFVLPRGVMRIRWAGSAVTGGAGLTSLDVVDRGELLAVGLTGRLVVARRVLPVELRHVLLGSQVGRRVAVTIETPAHAHALDHVHLLDLRHHRR